MSAKIAALVAAMVAALLVLTVVAAAAVETGVDILTEDERTNAEVDDSGIIISTDPPSEVISDENETAGDPSVCFPDGFVMLPRGPGGLQAAIDDGSVAGDMSISDFLAWAEETRESNQVLLNDTNRTEIGDCLRDNGFEPPRKGHCDREGVGERDGQGERPGMRHIVRDGLRAHANFHDGINADGSELDERLGPRGGPRGGFTGFPGDAPGDMFGGDAAGSP